MIELNEKAIAIWFLQLTETSDWMGSISWETEEGMKNGKGNIKLTYRIRYYDEEDPGNIWEGKDRKSWYSGVMTDSTKEEAISKTRLVVQKLANIVLLIPSIHKDIGKIYECINNQGIEKFMDEFTKQPFTHMRVMKEDEAKEYFREIRFKD